jgi:cell division protein FtsN
VTEQSYYEIALTNRQVMTIFIVLLFCLLVAFLSGVWVGREGTGLPIETVAAQAMDAGVAAKGAPIEELDFFSRPQSEGTSPEESAAATTETAGPVETASQGYEQPAIIEESPETPGGGASPPRAGERAEERPGPSAGSQGASRDLVVQVFSSADRDQADRVYQQLREGGFSPVMSPVEVSGKVMYRVRLGPYSDRAEAQSVADRVRRAFKLDTWITR